MPFSFSPAYTRYDFDFYLQAHAGIQGTVKPTHYTVVYDRIGLGADEIQKNTNLASYMYARARSVSGEEERRAYTKAPRNIWEMG